MLIGRIPEQAKLKKAYNAEESQFVVVYGRRRVGKTYLVKETFNYKFTFFHAGLSKKNTRTQLHAFQLSLRNQGMPDAKRPENWLEAFNMLERLLEAKEDRRKTVFIDEIPWMDANRSGFLAAFENFWNNWASGRKDICLIICGSATSWILKKILKNKGGLHGRTTCRIPLEPFTLNECRQYAESQKLGMNDKQILDAYMIFGGVPYYWTFLEAELSLAQNVDKLLFSKGGDLKDEFSEVYSSLFTESGPYMKIINVLGHKNYGLTREDIIAETNISDNGSLSTELDELEKCGFIRSYQALGKKKKGTIYQLIDNFSIFNYKIMEDCTPRDEHYWTKIIDTPTYNTWCGLAFERVCLQHVRQIKDRLSILGIISSEYSWRSDTSDGSPSVQIDLLIDRSDDTVNLCEMKYSKTAYSLDAEELAKIEKRRDVFRKQSGTNKAIKLTMVTSNGLVPNSYAKEIQNQIVAEDLFRP